MSERVFIGVAWPYANGPLHLGHVAGAYLPADIFARYHRLKGDQVLMVSGSDQHGTPITLRAEEEGKTPAEIADTYHREFLASWQKLGISFDLFTTTSTENHTRVVHDIFLRLLDKGFIYKDTASQAYCPDCARFLPDRYIEGVCPFCNTPKARGDQCDSCGKPLNPVELKEPYCRICHARPQFRETEHFFFRLTAFRDQLLSWVKAQTHWRANVLNFTTRYLEEGLKDRPITRDIEWGVTVPVKGWENKRIYVWFEAVIGYLSASREWAAAGGDPEAWHPFWEGGTRGYYFIGKDNIPFHTLIWPAMLMGNGGLNLPYDVPANEFLTIEGKKLSTSRNWAVWLPDYLSRYDPEPLRYLLSVNMPESSDTDFSWREFVRRNNDELVATYGNLVNRVLTLVFRNYGGVVPEHSRYNRLKPYLMPGEDLTRANILDGPGASLVEHGKDLFRKVGDNLAGCHFRQALQAVLGYAQEANQYLDGQAPWKVIKQDRQAAADSLYTAIYAITCLKTVLCPVLPFSSQRVHEYLGFTGDIRDYGWEPNPPPPGQRLVEPKPLFVKLEDKLIEAETARLGK
jgi:methionyl-tRNA synthetase